MYLSLPATLLSFSALSSATFFLAAQESTEFSVGEGKPIQWDPVDFDTNLDIYLGPEDANEDDETAGTKIASDVPNVGTYTFIPKPDPEEKYGKKKKIWGHDKKGKKGKKGGIGLIIIIIKKPGDIVKKPEYPYPPVTQELPPVTQPIPQLPPTTTLTEIKTRTSVINTHVTATETVISPPVKTPELPPVIIPTVIAPSIELPTVITPTVITPTIELPKPTGPILTTAPGTGTIIRPTATSGTSPPIFTGGASVPPAKPLLAGGLMGLLVLGMLGI